MKKYILVIDNEQLICSGLKRALSQEQLQIDTVSTVTDALIKHNSSDFDLCLLDIRLDENGLSLIERVRKCWPDMKIILMTTCEINPHDDNDMDEYIQHAGKNGVSHYLCKPFNLQQLRDVVCHALN